MPPHPNRSRKTAAKAAATATPQHNHDLEYAGLLTAVAESFDIASAGHARLFCTDADGLNDLYLDLLPSDRQVHNCSACRRFIRAFGGLVAIKIGATVPVMWNPDTAPPFYAGAFRAMRDHVAAAKVTSVFLTKLETWGTPITGEYRHMAVIPPAALLHRDGLLTPGQAMAAVTQNVATVSNAMLEYSPAVLDEALRLFRADVLARSDKFIGPVQWLRDLHDWPKGSGNHRIRQNLLWRAVASAPEGFCHIRASVVAPILDDIRAGVTFAEIARKHGAKVAPLQYQRPQAPPSAGNIKQAEDIVAKLGLAPALERRFARHDELHTIWRPGIPKAAPAGGGVFSHLTAKQQADDVRPVDMPLITMTWDKFSRTVLATADAMDIHVPRSGTFIAMTTAVHADAPPILKWDREGARNPVAWYVYPHGSDAAQWGLQAGAWAKIVCVSPLPTLWGDHPMPYLYDGAVLIIEGAVDSNNNSLALYPETLRDDLRAVRATIEAHSKSGQLAGHAEASACGYDLRKGSMSACTIRIRVGSAWTSYRIDRWD